MGALEREEREKGERGSKPDSRSRGSRRGTGPSPTALGAMAPKAPSDAKKGREKGKGKGKDEDSRRLFDQAREQLQDLKTRMERAKKRRDARAQRGGTASRLAEARRRSREEVPGQSSFRVFSSSSRGPLEREREPKAGPRKKEEKKRSEEKRKEEVKKEEVSRALSEAPWRRAHRESPKPGVPAPKRPPKTPPKTKAKPVEPRTPPPKAGTPARTPRVQPPPTPKKEKEEESEENMATAAAKWKAGAGKPTMLPRPKLLRSPVSWAGMQLQRPRGPPGCHSGQEPEGHRW